MPTAAFTSASTNFSCNLTGTSTDSDGNVTTWNWNFGDGSSSALQNPNAVNIPTGSYDWGNMASFLDPDNDTYDVNSAAV